MKNKLVFVYSLLVFSLWANASKADVCWKSTYGRGVGTIPTTCDPQQTKSGLLCYQKCKPGYTNVAGICWQGCPADFKDTGAHCLKPGSYGRGAGYVLWKEGDCKKDNQKTGCEKSGLLWYPKCKAGFHAVGCCVCSPNCPPGTKDIGVSCQKDTYIVPPITPNCGVKDYDAGLCYNRCNSGYNGIGPVCWGKCPPDRPVDCGALCGTSVTDCVKSIGEMVLSVGQVVAKVAETIATLGTSTSLTAGLQVIKDSAINSLKEVAKKAAKEAAKVGAGVIVRELENRGVPSAIASKLASMTTDPDNFDYVGFLKGLDPTGLAKVVDAFNKQICAAPAS